MIFRTAMIFATALAAPLMTVFAHAEEPFGFEAVKERAKALAAEAHHPPERAAEPFLKMDYDAYRMIAAERNNALWRDGQLPFWAEFFPAGFIFEYPVEINTV